MQPEATVCSRQTAFAKLFPLVQKAFWNSPTRIDELPPPGRAHDNFAYRRKPSARVSTLGVGMAARLPPKASWINPERHLSNTSGLM